MRVISPSYITYICIEILGGTARGCGDSVIPMLLTCFGICVLRVVWILAIVPLRPELSTVAFSYPLTWTVTSVMFIDNRRFFTPLLTSLFYIRPPPAVTFLFVRQGTVP